MTTAHPGDVVRYDGLYYEVESVEGELLRLWAISPQDTLAARASDCTVIARQVPMAEAES